MKKSLFTTLLSGFIFTTTQISAQVSAYTFSSSTGNYGASSNGTMVGNNMQDDDVNLTGIPFSFTFNGVPTNSVYVCSNGFLSFGMITGTEYNPISDMFTQNIISAFGQDLEMGINSLADITIGSNTMVLTSVSGFSVGDVLMDFMGDFGSVNPTITAVNGNSVVVNLNATASNQFYFVKNSNGYIKQDVFGPQGSQVCEFEFKNFTRFGVADEHFDFKIRLHETTNQIEFLYGNSVIGNDFNPLEVGLKGSSNSDYNSRSVLQPTPWNNSINATSITDYCEFEPGFGPASGLTYVWSPATCVTPTLVATHVNTVSCEGTSVTISVSGANNYTWSIGMSAAQIIVTPTTTTVYTVTGSNGSCTATLSLTHSVVSYPAISVSVNNAILCKGQSATLTAIGANTYTWSNSQTGSLIAVTPTVSSQYTVSGSNGVCVAEQSTSITVDNCTDISTFTKNDLSLIVFPNPFTDALFIKADGLNAAKIIIHNTLGKVVFDSINEIALNESINTSNFEKGVYFVSIVTSDNTKSLKLIKE